ncbi:SDR family oxidoreductase [Paenibacillus tarimensis]|uniref:SDR family oxidoreductase n=1 Tax=Paenibacillus tarimensis TaxID=416012 RepID=UPI001F324CBD|nr:SDR family oxidoreductase [Paenibacillus tarimensis]MCF2946356.1 SDR family oxidoreductase [Paenibacillus tarimensis]
MKMLVTGATGKLGARVVETLLKSMPASQLAVSVRDPQKAEALKARGVEVRQGDFDHPETLDSAFAGIDRLLIISTDGDTDTRIRQHTNAVEAAQRAKIGFIAYTSATNARESSLFLAEVHRVTEEAILKTGIPYSFLRNNWYLENEIGKIQGAANGQPWVTSAGSGRAGWALQQEYAEAAAAVLAGSGHENTTYELGGKLLTQEELVSEISSVLGKEVPVLQVDDSRFAGIMKDAGVPDFVIPILVGIERGIREGALEVESNDMEKLIGRPLTPIKEALTQIINESK